jgi:MFS family permease
MVVVLALAGVVSVLDRTILNVIVDPVRADLGLSDVEISLLQGLAFGLFYATAGLPLGLTVDRYSRRLVVIAGITVWSLATLYSGFARNFGELFAARLLVGLGEAALSPAAISLIADLFPPTARGRPISLFLMGQAAANGLGISITSFITDAAAGGAFSAVPIMGALAPWRTVFIVCGLAGFVVVIGLLPTREPIRRVAGPPVGALVQTRAAIGFFRQHAGVFVPLYLGFAVCFLANYGAAAWNPTMLMRAYGVTRAELGAVLGPLMFAFSLLGPLLGGLLVDAVMRRGDNLARFGILVAAPLFIVPAGVAALAPNSTMAMILIATSPAAVAVIGTTTLALLQSMVEPGMRGVAVALTGLLNTVIGATTGPLLISLLTERVYGDPRMVGMAIISVVVPSLLLASGLYWLTRQQVRKEVAARSAPASLLAEIDALSGKRTHD